MVCAVALGAAKQTGGPVRLCAGAEGCCKRSSFAASAAAASSVGALPRMASCQLSTVKWSVASHGLMPTVNCQVERCLAWPHANCRGNASSAVGCRPKGRCLCASMRCQAMVPMWDALNHVPGQANVRLRHSARRGALQMVATAAVSAGNELINCYGELCNAELLRRYAFVVTGLNPHACCQVLGHQRKGRGRLLGRWFCYTIPKP
jgi:hypothetical protein